MQPAGATDTTIQGTLNIARPRSYQ